MDPDPRFEFQPVEAGDKDYASSLNVLARFFLNKDNFVMKQRDFIEDGTVKGLGVAKTVWRRRTQESTVRNPAGAFSFMGKRKPRVEKKTVLAENRPEIVYVDPNDFFWDPAATCDSNWRYVFHRTWLTLNELKARAEQGVYKNIDELRGLGGSDSAPRGVHESSKEAQVRRGGRYEVLERWHIDGTVMVMCNNVTLRDDPNPYFHGEIPFAVYRSQPTPRSLVGVSEIEKIDHIQQAIWTRDNQRIDAASLTLNQVLILDPTIKGVRNLRFQPGAKIYANAGQRVEQLRLDAMQNVAFGETEAYLGAMQQVTGASPYLAGSDLSQSGIDQNTATGAQIMQEEGNKRMHMKRLEFQLFESRIAKQMIQLCHQYLSAAEVERIIGDDIEGYRVLSPEEIPMFFDVYPQGMSESMSKTAEMNTLIEVFNIAKDLHNVPMPDGSVFTIKPFIEKAIKLQGYDPKIAFAPMPSAPEVPVEAGSGG
jgi:hypothetical protein